VVLGPEEVEKQEAAMDPGTIQYCNPQSLVLVRSGLKMSLVSNDF
jgi:hypothetical protein